MNVDESDAGVTEVGRMMPVFVAEVRLSGLRRWVGIELAKQEIRHGEAAARADVSGSYWSKILTRKQIRPADLEIIASGLGCDVDEIVSAVGVNATDDDNANQEGSNGTAHKTTGH